MPLISRHLSSLLASAGSQFPVVTVTGPRQSGKTTLVRDCFSQAKYVSLEEPDLREFAKTDPRSFLRQFQSQVIFDEIQRAPELLSYLQVAVDNNRIPGQYILTGSQNFLLREGVSQSLAGRTALFHLLPLTLAELLHRPSLRLAEPAISKNDDKDAHFIELMSYLFRGAYPALYKDEIDENLWLRSYYQTYLERDVRSVLNVQDLDAFSRFMRLLAGRSGQLLDATALGNDVGVAHTTIRKWLSVLEASFVVFQLLPHSKNFNKRLVKSPKFYFYDTGLLCFLLGIRSPTELFTHSMRGAIFETMVVSEFMKNMHHKGLMPSLYFWRDSAGHEIDLIVEDGNVLHPIEIKSAETFHNSFFDNLRYWQKLTKDSATKGMVVYGGNHGSCREDGWVLPWFTL